MSNKSSRGVYEVVFRLRHGGRGGGMGPKKSFFATMSSPKDAKSKIRRKGQECIIVAVRKA
jgi:hypothetical protein